MCNRALCLVFIVITIMMGSGCSSRSARSVVPGKAPAAESTAGLHCNNDSLIINSGYTSCDEALDAVRLFDTHGSDVGHSFKCNHSPVPQDDPAWFYNVWCTRGVNSFFTGVAGQYKNLPAQWANWSEEIPDDFKRTENMPGVDFRTNDIQCVSIARHPMQCGGLLPKDLKPIIKGPIGMPANTVLLDGVKVPTLAVGQSAVFSHGHNGHLIPDHSFYYNGIGCHADSLIQLSCQSVSSGHGFTASHTHYVSH